MRFKLISAVHLFLLRDDQILLLRRFNTGYEDGNYSVVAGHLDGGEPVKTAMIREAREEVGIELSEETLEVVQVMHRLTDHERIDFFLQATQWRGDIQNLEPHKCDDLAWYPLNHLPLNTIPYIRRAINNYHQKHWFDTYGWKPGEF